MADPAIPLDGAFVASMPETYRRAFDAEAIEAHAQIVQRRGDRAAHVEIWSEQAERVTALCVVADDVPGLLSRISAALVAHELDVVGAQAYGRKRPDGRAEAVDLLWVRRLPTARGTVPPLRARDVERIADTLESLVRGKATFEQAVPFARAVRKSGGATRVRFEEDGALVTLTVEADDRPGLLLLLTQTLFKARVQVVASTVTTREGRVIDRFTLTELDGGKIRPLRLLEVQTAVLGAIDTRRA